MALTCPCCSPSLIQKGLMSRKEATLVFFILFLNLSLASFIFVRLLFTSHSSNKLTAFWSCAYTLSPSILVFFPLTSSWSSFLLFPVMDACIWLCVCEQECNAHRGQQMSLNSLELESETFVNHQCGRLGTEFGFSARTLGDLNHWAIFHQLLSLLSNNP